LASERFRDGQCSLVSFVFAVLPPTDNHGATPSPHVLVQTPGGLLRGSEGVIPGNIIARLYIENHAFWCIFFAGKRFAVTSVVRS